MKICIVTSCLRNGGAERVAASLANGFVAHGHDVMVLTNLYEKQVYKLDTKVVLDNFVGSFSNKFLKWVKAIFILRKLLKKNKPDVVIGIMEFCSFLSRMATVGLKIPVIATEHNSFDRPKEAALNKFGYFAKFKLNKIYKLVTVLTKADKDFIGKRLSNIVVMPNPLCLEVADKEKLLDKKPVIVAAGRVDAWHCKGFDVLLNAWAKIANQHPNWKILIAGNWKEQDSYSYLENIIEQNDIQDSVEFLGFQNDIQKVFQKASIFVLSSRYEGFGLVLIEAMSQGCACVACDYKGRQKEIIQNENEGILCKPDDIEDLARSIDKMITDEAYRHEVQRNAIERSKFYSQEHIVGMWEEVITNVKKQNK